MARPWEERARQQKIRNRILRILAAMAAIPVVGILWGLWVLLPLENEEALVGEEEAGFEFFIQGISYPDWFANSRLNLLDDLAKAKAAGKKGIALYFARDDCPCCEVMKQINLEDPAIIATIDKNFDAVAIDTLGEMPVTGFDGKIYSEVRFATLMQASATPSMLFFDINGKKLFHLRGYYDSYYFRSVLDYILSHRPTETFEQYRGYLFQPELFDEYFELHDNKVFLPPPYQLDRSKVPAERPLAVFFERGHCPACDYMHAQLMNRIDIIKPLQEMDVVQLDITSHTPVLTPDGIRTDSMEWAEYLGIHYTPTIIFFDRQGRPIQRVESIIELRRLDQAINAVFEIHMKTAGKDKSTLKHSENNKPFL